MTVQELTTELDRDPLVGALLGPYEVIAHVASGGMGAIYCAQHATIGGTVAIKMMHDQLVDQDKQVDRFLNEARTINRIGHPNIVRVHDFVDERGAQPPRVYLVMEYLVGRTLSTAIEASGGLDPREAIQLALGVCEGLAAIHEVGVLHLDLKPDNVFLARSTTGGPATVKLVDFGVAVALDEGKDSVRGRDPKRLVGTPRYMSPEQILGRPLDVRSDIYSFGLLLYAMLSGKPPLADIDTPAVLLKQVNEPPPPLESGTGAHIDKPLRDVVTRCLQKTPADRFQTARELHDALARCRPRADMTGPGRPLGLDPTARSIALLDASEHELPLAPPKRRLPWVAVLTLVLGGVAVGVYLATMRDGERSANAADSGAYSGSAKVPAKAVATRPAVTPRATGASSSATGASSSATGASSSATGASSSATGASSSATGARASATRPGTGASAGSTAARPSVGTSEGSSARAKTALPAAAARRRAAARLAARRRALLRAKKQLARKQAKGTSKGSGKPDTSAATRERIKRGGTLNPFDR